MPQSFLNPMTGRVEVLADDDPRLTARMPEPRYCPEGGLAVRPGMVETERPRRATCHHCGRAGLVIEPDVLLLPTHRPPPREDDEPRLLSEYAYRVLKAKDERE